MEPLGNGRLAATPTRLEPAPGTLYVVLGNYRADAQAWMKAGGASEIMHPSSIVVLGAIPLLGSGKINYVALAKALRDSEA
jgi:hypothetical protein